MATTMRTAIGYVRVSSEEQADSGLGLEAQRQRIRTYCELKGLSLATIFEDAGVSGGRALSTRPAGSLLMAEARKNKPILIVAKFDRLFRSVADAAQTIVDFASPVIEAWPTLPENGESRLTACPWCKPPDGQIRKSSCVDASKNGCRPLVSGYEGW
jgi:hypothetical protein